MDMSAAKRVLMTGNNHNQAFNVRADALNSQIRRRAEIAVEGVPGCDLQIVARPGVDQRTDRTMRPALPWPTDYIPLDVRQDALALS
jgi:hypothetical protein